VLPGFAGTNLDEMTLNHLMQIPAYFDTLTWSTSDASTTTLLSLAVEPRTFFATGITNLWAWKDMIPVSYFCQMFGFWRGSFVFTLKIVKTQFHTGRLLVSFNPGTNTSPSFAQSSYLLREIIDVHETSEFSFVVPYVSTKQYHKNGTYAASSIVDALGNLSIRVLSELVCPDTVSSSVKIIVEVAGGPDFEVMCPRAMEMQPFIDSSWASQMADVIKPVDPSSRRDMNQKIVGIGSASIERHTIQAAEYCVGEKINSVLQLLKRFTSLRWFGDAVAVFSKDFRPYAMTFAYSADPVGLVSSPSLDAYTLIAPCYAYVRGSLRVMFYNNASGGLMDGAVATIYPSPTTTLMADASTWNYPGVSTNIQSVIERPVVGMQIPAYQQLHSRLVRISTSALVEPVDMYSSNIRAKVVTTVAGAACSTVMFRAAGDDLTLGYFLGTPRVVLYGV